MQRPWGRNVLEAGRPAKRLEDLGLRRSWENSRRGSWRGGQGWTMQRWAGATLGLWEVTGQGQAAEHCDLICIFLKALSEGCVIAKDRTHSQDHTWKLVNMERYTSVSLSPDAGTAGRGQPSGTRVASLPLLCLRGLSSQPLCASLNRGPTQALQPLPCVQPYRDSLTHLSKYSKFPEERS